jgi:hypothetical protein
MHIREAPKKESYMQDFRAVFFPTPSNDKEMNRWSIRAGLSALRS